MFLKVFLEPNNSYEYIVDSFWHQRLKNHQHRYRLYVCVCVSMFLNLAFFPSEMLKGKGKFNLHWIITWRLQINWCKCRGSTVSGRCLATRRNDDCSDAVRLEHNTEFHYSVGDLWRRSDRAAQQQQQQSARAHTHTHTCELSGKSTLRPAFQMGG